MPKKKKSKPGDRDEASSRNSQQSNRSSVGKSDRQPGMIAHGIGGGDEESEAETRTQELRYLQDMFEGKLDPVVVHMIMNDCEFKVEAALETLFKLVDQTSSFEAGMFRRSGFQDVYIPKMEAEGDSPENSVEDAYEEELHFAAGNDPQQQTQRTPTSEKYAEEGMYGLSQFGDVYIPTMEAVRDPPENAGEEAYQEELLFAAGGNDPQSQTQRTLTPPLNLNILPYTGPRGAHTVDRSSLQIAAQSHLTDLRIKDSKPVLDGEVSEALEYSEPDLQGSSTGSAFVGPAASGPATLGPAASGPAASDHAASGPSASGPAASGPATSGPTASGPAASGPATSGPTASGPATSGPTASRPATSVHAASGPSASGPAYNPVNTPSDDPETLNKKLSDKSTEGIETIVTEHQLGQDEKFIDPSSTTASSAIPLVTTMGRESSPRTSAQSPSSEFRADDHQSTQFRMEGWPDKPKINLDANTSAFVPTAFTGDHRQQAPQMRPQFPLSSFQHSRLPPRHQNRMPRPMPRPAGRASMLQRHVRPQDGKPFFTKKWNPRGVEPFQAGAFPNYPPPLTQPFQSHQPTGRDQNQPNSSSLVPSWLQNQGFSQNPTQQFQAGVRPQSFPTNPSHEGVSQQPPKWPIGDHPKYAQVDQGNSRKRDSEEQVDSLPRGNVLCLMRGCPGSGKSTLARKLVGEGMILSTDDFFVTGGRYKFDVTKLSDAHDWSHQKCQEAMTSGVTPIVIDNTNIERWTMKPYVVMAINHNYSVVFREPTTPWKFKIGKLFKYNTHNVPRDRIRVMIERFEKNVTVENILGSSKPKKRKPQQDQDNDKHPSTNKKGKDLKIERGNLKVEDAGESRKMRRNDEDDEEGLKDKQEDVHEGSRRTVGDSVAVSRDSKEQEESLSEDEMFVSDEDNNLDTFTESITCDASQGAEMESRGTGSTIAPQTEDKKEDAKMKNEEQLVEVTGGEDPEATHSPNKVNIRTKISNNLEEDDDIIAMVKYISETTYTTPDKKTQEGAGKGEERLESVGDDDLEAVISSITQGSYVPEAKHSSSSPISHQALHDEATGVETGVTSYSSHNFVIHLPEPSAQGSYVPPINQSSSSPILHQGALHEEATGVETGVSSYGSENFVIHLPEPSAQFADGDVNEQNQEFRRGRNFEDFTTETTDSGVSCKTFGSQQNPGEAPADIRQDRLVGDEAARMAFSQGGLPDPCNSQPQLQDGSSAISERTEDQDDFSAVMTEVADAASVLSHELTEIEHQENIDKSKVSPGNFLGASEELTQPHDGLNEQDDKTEEEDFSLMMNEIKDAASILSHDLTNIEKQETCKKDDIKDEISARETDILTGHSNLKQTDKIFPHTQEGIATLSQEIQINSSNEMRKMSQGSVEDNKITATPSSSNAVPSINDINSNNVKVSNQDGKVSSSPHALTTTSPSFLHHPNSEKHPVLTPLTPSPCSTPRSQSPSPLISPSSQDKTAVLNFLEKKKLRRSKSTKGTKMAAVFPKLSPGKVDWSELADASGSDVGRLTPEKLRSSSAEGISFTEAGTNTLPADFSCLQRLSSGEISENDVEKKGLRVVSGQARQLAKKRDITTSEESTLDLSSSSSPQNKSPIPSSFKLHKSTMTDQENNTSDNLEKLRALFPTVPQVDLEDILSRCEGDLEWVTNILLDDFSNSERSPLAKQHSNKTCASQNSPRDDSTQSGMARNQDKDAKLVEKQSKDQFSPNRLTQNLASSMISVVDDILKSISTGDVGSATSSPCKQETSTSVNKSQNATLDSPQHSSRINNLLRELDPRNLAVEFAEVEQDSFSEVEGPPKVAQQEDTNASQKLDIPQEEKQTPKDSSPTDERLEDKQKITANRDPHPETLLNENKDNVEDGKLLEGCTQEEPDPKTASPLVENQRPNTHSDDTSSTLAAAEIKLEEANKGGSQRVAESKGATPEPRREQVVRPKTPSRSASMKSHSKPKRDKADEVDNLRARMKQDSTSLRRDMLEAAGGVQLSWKQQGEEEFRVPRPEQTMTRQGESGEMEDGEVMTEEKADITMQARTKTKELSNLKEGLMLQLDPAFALQLQEMFGSAGFYLLPDGLPAEDLQVHVDYDLAKQLHSLWARTLTTRFEQEEEEVDSMIKADEELARRLQQQEDINHMAEVQTARSAKYQESKASPTRARKLNSYLVGYGDNKGMIDPLTLPRQSVQETTSLKEIMDEQLAAQLSKDVETEEKLECDGSVSIATKLKKDKLFEEFPSIDRDTLEEIFRANNFQLESTIGQVKSFFMSASDRPKDVYTDEALELMEKRQIEQAERESLASSSEGTDDSASQEGSCFQSVSNPDYVDYRAEATQHYRQRHEAFQKAAAAYKRGFKDLASFYSQQGHLHTEKMKEANQRASEVILTSRNSLFSDNTLDLHGLHVDEALLMLNKVLEEKKAEFEAFSHQPHPPVTKPPPRHMFIITGKGNHSRGGVPRIRPAVTDLLKRAGFRYTLANAGLIKVNL
ncbi:uncharacterized protein [Asterias amurensis]|uniref:uncharacterized protein n=1 Tax=Asterias amurensis TaxID=7602 RepID=UPI003AB597F3